MGYMTDGLTFNTLRAGNRERLPQFRNAKGQLVHLDMNGSDWDLSKWMNAAAGELGEAANVIKKIERGDMSLDEAREHLAFELADIVTYIDLVANRAGINLGQAVMDKFNVVSDRVGAKVYLHPDDWHRFPPPNIQNMTSPYGFCPTCGAPGINTERRPDGHTICAQGHSHPAIQFQRRDGR